MKIHPIQMNFRFFHLVFALFSLLTPHLQAQHKFEKNNRLQTRVLFPSYPLLNRIVNPELETSYFQFCQPGLKSCQRITRDLGAKDLEMEKQLLQKQFESRFRQKLPAGTVYFNEAEICTLTGITIASVPGLAGGAVVCIHTSTHKVRARELPFNIQALDDLSKELGHSLELIARGEDGEAYVANPDLILQYLQNKYPLEPAPGKEF